ncbi:MAG: hAT transposon family protein [Candidatus Thiodiazotropha sp.]
MAEKQTKKIYDFPGKAKSAVWKHFGFHAIDGDGPLQLNRDFAICKHCHAAIKFTGNTTNQQNHLDKKHGTFVDQKASVRQPTINDCIQSTTKLGFHAQKAMEITKAIGEHVILDMKPLSSVESPSFRNILAKAEPRYTVPSRTYFKDTFIPKLYESTKAQVIEELKASIGGVSITTDCWTSHATESYMTVTAHFVTKQYELKSYVLQTRELDERHTAEHLAIELQKCATEWGLDKPTVVSDNAANILKAVKILNWRSVPCLAHTINLAAKTGLRVQQVSKILAKSRDIVGYFKRNAYATTTLHKKQSLLQMKELNLIQDVDTRWNSTYDMLDRLLSQTAPIHATFAEADIKRDRSVLLTADEQANAEELLIVLKELKTATTIVCDQKTPSISMILPVLLKLKKSLSVSESDSNLVRAVKTAALGNLDTRYLDENLNLHLVICTLLDPRYKDMAIDENTKTDAINAIIESAAIVQDAVEVQHVPVKSETDTVSEVLPPLPTLPSALIEQAVTPKIESDVEIPTKKLKVESVTEDSFLDDWFSDVVFVKEEKKVSDRSEIIRRELTMYLALDRLSSKTDPLVWWKMQRLVYPTLSNLAAKFLATPATSVPSERVFSTAGYTVNKQRSSLASENVDKLIFLNKNYKVKEPEKHSN